jgi:NADH-quinone oxidoreductase subunit J
VRTAVVAAAVALGLAVCLAATAVVAQPRGHDHAGHDHAGHDHAGHDHAGHDHPDHAAAADGKTLGFGNSRPVALVFWLFALAAVGGSLFVITRRNLVSAAMGMVATFFAFAGLYAMLHAHFIAVIQILVYAGAIMVLFVFVIMILNREEEEPWSVQGLLGKGVAIAALGYLLFRVASVLWKVREVHPPPELSPLEPLGYTSEPYAWGWTEAIGKVLFTDYLFPFEAISVVLLVAIVGALAIAHPAGKQDKEQPEGAAEEEAAK